MTHKIPPKTLNTNINYCIDEYVRLYEHRDMLREFWFCGLTIEQIAEKHKIGVTTAKDVLYGIGDDILLMASEMK